MKTMKFFEIVLNRKSFEFSVANSEPAQMPIENLAKIFGPTVLGYSCADPDHHAILSETMVQKDVNTSADWQKVKIIFKI